jgi:hypothetical protein
LKLLAAACLFVLKVLVALLAMLMSGAWTALMRISGRQPAS